MNRLLKLAGLRLTGALLRRVLMPCLLFTSSSSLTGLNMKEAPDLEAGGRQPCLFSYVRHGAHSNRLPLPTWCHSLESGQANSLTWKGDWSFTWHKIPAREKSHVLTCRTAVAAAFRILLAVVAIKIILAGRTCVYCWLKHIGVREGYSSFQQKANAFVPTAELTWITAWRCISGSCRRASLCLARGRLSSLLPVSSGSCSIRSFFPVVIEVDQLALKREVTHVGFLIKTTCKSFIYDYVYTEKVNKC